MKLANKIALISGGGTGIGKAIALLFAAEGAHVMVTGRRKELLEETVGEVQNAGGDAGYRVADYRRIDQIEASIDHAVTTFGGLDILVNNAGVANFVPIEAITEEDYDYQTHINLKGLMFSTKFAIPAIAKRGGGSIVNISSGAGLMAVANSSIYGATKAGVVHLTKIVAREAAERNIRINCICPGFVDTPIFETFIPLDRIEDLKIQFGERTPLKRIGRPDDVAKAALYLVSEDAEWVTGSVLTVDGGLNIA